MVSSTIPVSCNKDCGAGCPLIAHVQNGKIVKITDNPLSGPHITGCARGFMAHEANYHPARLMKPLIRSGRRGSGDFHEANWDEALDLVAEKLLRNAETLGPAGLLRIGGSGACRGALHHTSTITKRFLGLIGGFTDTVGNFSRQAMDFMTPLLVGSRPHGIDPQTLRHANLIVLWGANVQDTRFGAELAYRLRERKNNGTPIYVIDPRRTRTVESLGTETIKIFPGTDAAFMCAVLHELEKNGCVETGFVEKYTAGFDVVMNYVNGKFDDVPKSPAWASPICGVSGEEIRRFAHVYGKTKPAAIIPGLSLQRTLGGEETSRLTVALQAATGNIGIPGGSTGLSVWGALPNPGCGRMQILHDPKNFPQIPVYTWADSVLEGDVRFIYNVGGNYISQSSDVAKSIAAFNKADFIVTHDLFLTPTAVFSDVVLPVASFLERRDILFPSMNWLLFSERAVPPPGETKTDYDIFCLLSEKLKCRDRFSEGKSEDGWIETFLSQSEVENRDDFIKTGFFRGKDQERTGLSDFIREPAKKPLDTPSGRIELASSAWAKKGMPAIPLLNLSQPGNDYPLRMVTPHARYRINSQNFNSKRFDRMEPQRLWIHCADAEEREIKDGDEALVESSRGRLIIKASVTSGLMRGVVSLNQGAWPRFDIEAPDVEAAGAANVLTSTEPTMPSFGSRTHSVEVQVRKYTESPRNRG